MDNRNANIMAQLANNSNMNMDDYQNIAVGTAIYGQGEAIIYPVLGLTNEAGEVAGKVKKVLRDKGGDFTAEGVQEGLKDELGDVLWYLAATARDLGLTLGEIAQRNLAKLADRKARNVIHGSGDHR